MEGPNKRGRDDDDGCVELPLRKRSVTTPTAVSSSSSGEQPSASKGQFVDQENGALLLHALSFLDVATLLQKQTVSKTWKKLCTKAIDLKCGEDGPKAFESRQELQQAVDKYCKYTPEGMEELSAVYGFPIDKWNVSKVEKGWKSLLEAPFQWGFISTMSHSGILFRLIEFPPPF